MANPVTHFEIVADDTARAKKFYETMFGWKIDYMKEYDYFMVKAKSKDAKGNDVGIDGGMMKRRMPGQPFTVYVSVDSIDAALKKAAANGGKVVMPRTPISMGAIGAFFDTEGNLIGLHEMPSGGTPKKMPKSVKSATKRIVKKSVKKKKR